MGSRLRSPRRERGARGRRARLSQRRVPARPLLIALLGDTHLPRGARSLPAECLRILDAADAIVHTGDFTAASVLADLERLAPVTAVHGNMDDAELRRLLPVRTTVELEGIRIGLVHDGGPAHGRRERLRELFPGCDLIAYGHSHMPEAWQDPDGWILNPGSPTERRRAPEHTMVLIRAGKPDLITLRA